MKKSQLNISEAVSTGWGYTKLNYPILIGSFAVLMAIGVAFAIIENIIGAMGAKSTALSVVGVLALATLVETVLRIGVQNLTSIGFTRIQLNILDNQPTKIGQLFHPEDVFWRYLGGSIVYGLIVIGGIILLIVPGVIWAIKYQFALPLIVDKKMGIMEAITKSGQMTKGYKGWLFGLAIVLGLINLAGLLALFIGLLITVPLTAMAQIWVYRQLLANESKTTIAAKTA